MYYQLYRQKLAGEISSNTLGAVCHRDTTPQFSQGDSGLCVESIKAVGSPVAGQALSLDTGSMPDYSCAGTRLRRRLRTDSRGHLRERPSSLQADAGSQRRDGRASSHMPPRHPRQDKKQ